MLHAVHFQTIQGCDGTVMRKAGGSRPKRWRHSCQGKTVKLKEEVFGCGEGGHAGGRSDLRRSV